MTEYTDGTAMYSKDMARQVGAILLVLASLVGAAILLDHMGAWFAARQGPEVPEGETQSLDILSISLPESGNAPVSLENGSGSITDVGTVHLTHVLVLTGSTTAVAVAEVVGKENVPTATYLALYRREGAGLVQSDSKLLGIGPIVAGVREDGTPDDPIVHVDISARPEDMGPVTRTFAVIGGALIEAVLRPDMIVVETPGAGGEVMSPLIIRGEARGPWYFEASFPVELRTESGVLLAQAPARALGEWITTEFVPFEATLEFTVPTEVATGMLILRKDNPSGLPENDAHVSIPVKFAR